MKPWHGYIYFNGEDCSIAACVDFEVTDELYEQMQEALKENKPFIECEFYEELSSCMSYDLLDYISVDNIEPDRDDYDNDEEYEEALQEYQDYEDNIYDSYYLESEDIYDPGDYTRLAEAFIGRSVPNSMRNDSLEYSLNCEYDYDRIVRYSLTIHYDKDGVVTDITDIEGEAMECESIGSSEWGDSYPDFGYLEEVLEEYLSDEGK